MKHRSRSTDSQSVGAYSDYQRKSFHRGGRPWDSESTYSSHSKSRSRKRRRKHSSDQSCHNNQELKRNNDKKKSPKKSGNKRYRSSFDDKTASKKERKKHDSSLAKKRKKRNDVIVKVGDIISKRFEVLNVLGEGSFGHVLEAKDKQSNVTVAIKALKHLENYKNIAKHEVNVLLNISQLAKSSTVSCCIGVLDFFEWDSHYFIVFPRLGDSVFTFLEKNDFQPYPYDQCISITKQLSHALKFLRKLGLTHTDLKPENILFVNDSYSETTHSNGKKYLVLKDTRLRVIDFGSATYENEHHSRTIQTRHYRAPEVILELGWSFPADVWSLGCIVFEIVTGICLFMTHDNLEHLAMMERVLGSIPKQMIRDSSRRGLFYKGKLDWDVSSSDGRYVRKTLKPMSEYWYESFNRYHRMALDLVRETLVYCPRERIDIKDVFTHPFLTSFTEKT